MTNTELKLPDELDKILLQLMEGRKNNKANHVLYDGVKVQLEQFCDRRVREARIDELKSIMNGQKTIRSFITSDGGEEQIVTYEFANTEIQDRLAQLTQAEDKKKA